MDWSVTSPKRLRAALMILLAWAALGLAVDQLVCLEEHNAGSSLESAACLVLAAIVVAHAGAPRLRRLLFSAPTSFVQPSPAFAPAPTLALSAARGSPIFITSRFRC
jgi:hypothetical protein